MQAVKEKGVWYMSWSCSKQWGICCVSLLLSSLLCPVMPSLWLMDAQ